MFKPNPAKARVLSILKRLGILKSHEATDTNHRWLMFLSRERQGGHHATSNIWVQPGQRATGGGGANSDSEIDGSDDNEGCIQKNGLAPHREKPNKILFSRKERVARE